MPFPFIGPTYQTQSKNVGVERLINLYVEATESPVEAQRATYYGTPGIRQVGTINDQPGRGIFVQDGRCFAIAGQSLVELTLTSDRLVTVWVRGTVKNDGRPVSFASNGLNGHQLFIVSGGSGYIFDLNTTALTELGGENFPPDVLAGGFLDGYFVALWADHFQISELYNGLTWNRADFGAPSFTPDRMVGMICHHREVWLFGEVSTEIWYNAGTSPFPFAPVPGVLVEMGTSAPGSIVKLDNGIAWFGRDRDGQRLVVFAPQYQPQRISTHAVEWALHGYPEVDDFVGYTYRESGHTFYVLTSVENRATWAYDVSVPRPYAWSERGWWNTTLGIYESQRQIHHAFAFGMHLMQDRTTGALYDQWLGIYDDAGVAIRSLRRLPHITPENRMTFFSRFELGIEPGVGLTAGQGVNPQLMLRWSDDGGHTWSSEQWVTAGKMGQYETRAAWHRLGRSRNRVFEVVQSDNVKRAWIWARVNAQQEVA